MTVSLSPVLSARHISVNLGGKQILDDVSIDVSPGELKVLIGPSGAGKSTFLQCLNFLIPPDTGIISLESHEIDAKNPRALSLYRRQVGMIFQDFNLFDHLTAVDNVAIALRKVAGLSRDEARRRAMAELDRVGLSQKSGLYPAELSGGQK